ncbi:uncharacterized protein J3D65DRAFT_639153 [Phyllosticta citribraziliensis]|uniref:J domain-containing protein n=1 Tax=Phyllosticta citribraziliensis TaxID=989973 RepID=A0ABR1L7P4_9PEZI
MSKDDVSDEAKALVSTDINLYELLGIEPTADAKQLKSAWRKTSLKYHPDKNQDNPEAVEKFYLAKNATELLSNPTLRAQYDTSREARAQKERANSLLDAKRRQMVADLEAGERGAKRKRAEEVDAEERLQRELKRLAQDGERRRREREEQKAKEREEEARRDYERDMRRRSGVHQANGTGNNSSSSKSGGAEERATAAATATPEPADTLLRDHDGNAIRPDWARFAWEAYQEGLIKPPPRPHWLYAALRSYSRRSLRRRARDDWKNSASLAYFAGVFNIPLQAKWVYAVWEKHSAGSISKAVREEWVHAIWMAYFAGRSYHKT